MKVKVLGCHGGHVPGYDTTSFYINDRFIIDAGSICTALSLEEQKSITDIIITHSHLDHIKDLCFLIENTFEKDRKTINVYSAPMVIKALRENIFNDLIWPDFTKIHASGKDPVLKFFEVEDTFQIGSIAITPFKVNHPANAIGYVVDDGDSQVVFTGDSGPTELTWEQANQCKNLKAIFTEISFPSRMKTLAQASGHYTLKTLSEDLKNLSQKTTPVYISHFKPLFLQELIDEFQSDATTNMKPLHADDELQFV